MHALHFFSIYEYFFFRLICIKKIVKHFLVGFLLSLIGVKSLAQSSFLQDLMKQSGKFEIILENPSKYKVQIIYTQINRNKGNIPTFNSFY